eukprot:979714-Pyramimonas_sp.AAC.1
MQRARRARRTTQHATPTDSMGFAVVLPSAGITPSRDFNGQAAQTYALRLDTIHLLVLPAILLYWSPSHCLNQSSPSWSPARVPPCSMQEENVQENDEEE